MKAAARAGAVLAGLTLSAAALAVPPDTTVTASAATPASAPDGAGATAPYNEAVRMVDGKRVVEVAPFPSHMQAYVSTFRRPDQNPALGSYVYVVETPGGLMDCRGTYWFHPNACSASTFGKEAVGRYWQVKLNGQWQLCIGRAKPVKCVLMIADGKLRPLPTPLTE